MFKSQILTANTFVLPNVTNTCIYFSEAISFTPCYTQHFSPATATDINVVACEATGQRRLDGRLCKWLAEMNRILLLVLSTSCEVSWTSMRVTITKLTGYTASRTSRQKTHVVFFTVADQTLCTMGGQRTGALS